MAVELGQMHDHVDVSSNQQIGGWSIAIEAVVPF